MNKMTPQIRFQGFTDDWEERKLGEVTESFDGKRIPIDSGLRISGEYPYYGATGIIDYVEDYIFDGEYVLLAEDGANITMRNYPVAYLTKGKFWLNNHAHIMRMIDGSNYFLVQILEKIDYIKYNTGTAQPKLNSKVVKNIEFNLPKVEEQEKIGSFFKQLDDTIALHQRKLDLLKEQKKGFLQKMFPKNGAKVPELRFSGFADDWEERKLGEHAKYRRGSFPQPYGNKEWYDGEGAMPFVQVVDVTNKLTLVENTKQKISKLAQSKSVFVPKGTVVVTLQGSIGRVAITQYDSFVDRTLLIFEDYEKETNERFWAYTIQKKFEIEKLKAPGGTIKTITKEALSSFDVHLPQFKEQAKIGSFFKQLDDTIALHQRKLDLLKEQKKGFLQKMFVS
ncbi:restriction endonuclease subunit S [Leuconostoc mesenteroides]|uniref:restriction endonuclease subunit S n=1 Tax=Leuconostoc mesenteroides TaxID=1245 RepID=UPI001CBBD800|nr:restriction endonuclease subunit S [Leuconostoc mesenteroides]MBZ1525263.1 restriction endonuclease subunit S [Leuconostoc mesenteroides]